jgi:hypothetical protein
MSQGWSTSSSSHSNSDPDGSILAHCDTEKEISNRIAVLQLCFVNYVSVDNSGDLTFKTPTKCKNFAPLQSIFGCLKCANLMWKYCNLLVEDAVFSQPFFNVDSELYSYIASKVCAPRDAQLVSKQTLKDFLLYKRNEVTSQRAKVRGQLLLDMYHARMRSCLQHWSSLYFSPSIRNSVYASISKDIWRKNKQNFLGKLFLSKSFCGTTDQSDNIFGIPRILT